MITSTASICWIWFQLFLWKVLLLCIFPLLRISKHKNKALSGLLFYGCHILVKSELVRFKLSFRLNLKIIYRFATYHQLLQTQLHALCMLSFAEFLLHTHQTFMEDYNSICLVRFLHGLFWKYFLSFAQCQVRRFLFINLQIGMRWLCAFVVTIVAYAIIRSNGAGSIPGVTFGQMKLQIKLGVPHSLQQSLDIERVKSVFP